MISSECVTGGRRVKVTLDSTSALWSFWSSRAAALVSSLRAAMWSAGRRTFPLVSFSRSRETTWSWPCCSATASGVKPSYTHIYTYTHLYTMTHESKRAVLQANTWTIIIMHNQINNYYWYDNLVSVHFNDHSNESIFESSVSCR